MAAFHWLRPKGQRGIIVIAACILVAGLAGWHYLGDPQADAAVNPADNAKARPKGPAAIPVTIQRTKTADFPVYLNGLGTVQPYNTVTVRSRVDGQVTKVNFRQGDIVKEGDLLVQIDPRPYQAALDQALAKKTQDEANLHNAELDLARYSTLAQQSFASRQQLDTQQANVNQLTAQVKGDQATIDNATTQLSYTTIKSPLTGKTGFRLVDPGNIVHASDTTGIVSIVKLQPISVVFTAPEENIGTINNALTAGTVPVTALASDGSKSLAEGHLALVDNQVDQASGTIRMKATFQNKDNALWPGLSVATKLLVETKKNAVVVPNDAIQHGPDGLYTYIVGDSNKVELRNLKVGEEGATQTVILDGLKSGERVVVAGQYRLTKGAVVDPREANVPARAADREAQNTPAKAP
ncbi:MAG TPA: efflux RND transporter periplasmic adaptor subunit [Pseudolabrys sp.]